MKHLMIALAFVLASGSMMAQTATPSGQTQTGQGQTGQNQKKNKTGKKAGKSQAERNTTPGSPTGSGGTGADDGSGVKQDTTLQQQKPNYKKGSGPKANQTRPSRGKVGTGNMKKTPPTADTTRSR